MKHANLSDEQRLNFEDLLDKLKEKIITDIETLKTQNKKLNKSLNHSISIYKSLENVSLITAICQALCILGLGGLTGYFGYQSYLAANNFSLTTALSETLTMLWLVPAVGSIAIIGVSMNQFSSINSAISKLLDTIITIPYEKRLKQKKSRTASKTEKNSLNISYLESTSQSIEEIRNNFKYLIHSSLKDKTFTEKEVALIYKYLTSTNISALIYLLYHDNISDIKRMTVEEKEALTQKLKQKINAVRDYSDKLQTEQVEKNNQVQENVRNRRVERLHTYPYDSLIETQDNNYESERKKSRH